MGGTDSSSVGFRDVWKSFDYGSSWSLVTATAPWAGKWFRLLFKLLKTDCIRSVLLSFPPSFPPLYSTLLIVSLYLIIQEGIVLLVYYYQVAL
jgi:hypothetical protein